MQNVREVGYAAPCHSTSRLPLACVAGVLAGLTACVLAGLTASCMHPGLLLIFSHSWPACPAPPRSSPTPRDSRSQFGFLPAVSRRARAWSPRWACCASSSRASPPVRCFALGLACVSCDVLRSQYRSVCWVFSVSGHSRLRSTPRERPKTFCVPICRGERQGGQGRRQSVRALILPTPFHSVLARCQCVLFPSLVPPFARLRCPGRSVASAPDLANSAPIFARTNFRFECTCAASCAARFWTR